MTTIYSGTVQNVTLDMLLYWLQRGWLPSIFDVTDLAALPLIADMVKTLYPTSNGRVYTAADWRGLVEVERDEYTATVQLVRAKLTETSVGFGGGRGFYLWAEQWKTNAVKLATYEAGEPPRFVGELVTWLQERYGCKLTHLPLTADQQEKWNELQEFTTIVEQEGMTLDDAAGKIGVSESGMRKQRDRLRAKLGVDPPWPQKR